MHVFGNAINLHQAAKLPMLTTNTKNLGNHVHIDTYGCTNVRIRVIDEALRSHACNWIRPVGMNAHDDDVSDDILTMQWFHAAMM